MNHYFIAIYDGVFPTEKLHTILQSNPTFTDLNVRPLAISSPRPFTLLVGEEHDALTTGLTDKYHLVTKELQALERRRNTITYTIIKLENHRESNSKMLSISKNQYKCYEIPSDDSKSKRLKTTCICRLSHHFS